MKVTHANEYVSMYSDEDIAVEFSFASKLATGTTLTGCTVTIVDSGGTDQTSTMITGTSVASPKVTFTVQNPTAVDIFEINLAGVSNDSKNYVGKINLEVIGAVSLVSCLGSPTANTYVTISEANEYIRSMRGHSNLWDTLSVAGKKYLLIQACRDIDRFNYIGKKYYDVQKREFPRDDHDTITGNCATPLTINSFKHTSFTNDTYGSYKANSNYWKYGTVHITAATPLYDIKNIDTSNVTTDIVTMTEDFSATPTTNTTFIAFEPLNKDIKYAQIEQAIYILENTGNNTIQNYRSLGAGKVVIGDVAVTFKDGATSKISLSPVAKKLMSQWIESYKRVLRG